MLNLVELDQGEAKSSIWQGGIAGVKRYSTFSRIGWYKFRILHSERGRSTGILDAGTVLWNLSTREWQTSNGRQNLKRGTLEMRIAVSRE